MPEYIYSCGKHTQTERHGMAENPIIKCHVCGIEMHRRPLSVAVNWNGLPPHLESARPPDVQKLIDGAPQRRDEYLKRKEKRNARS